MEPGLTGLILFSFPLFIGLKRAYYLFTYGSLEKGIDINLVLLLFVFIFIEAQISGFLTNQTQLLFMMGISGGCYQWTVIPLHASRRITGRIRFRTVPSSAFKS